MTRRSFRIVLVLLIGIAGTYGGILLWTKVLHAPEERLGRQDLTAALTPPNANDSASHDSASLPDPSAKDQGSVTGDQGSVTGTWIATKDSVLGYRVKEVLGGVDTEGIGRTNEVTGSITIDGTILTAAEFAVDITTIKSDSSRRDGQFTGRIMDATTFPTATFRLTQGVDFGNVPALDEDAVIEVTGDLTLRGVTRRVSFTLSARRSIDSLAILGSIDIEFSDYGIPNPSNAFVKTGDNGLLEFVLAFVRGK